MGVSYPPLLLVKKYSLFRVPVWEPGITSGYGMVQQGSCAFGTASCLHACLQHLLWFPPSGKEPMRMSFFFFFLLILVITFGRESEACTRYKLLRLVHHSEVFPLSGQCSFFQIPGQWYMMWLGFTSLHVACALKEMLGCPSCTSNTSYLLRPRLYCSRL